MQSIHRNPGLAQQPPSLLVRSAVATAMAAAIALPVQVQGADSAADSNDSAELREVVVTGSRIARRDFTSDSPIVTVAVEQLQNTSQVSIEQSLARLPQFVAAQNQNTSSGDITTTATSSPGGSTLNLRGLGSNRTLVLLDGRRTQPINASLAVDVNTIPTAALEGVEIITGGAGSTYGADAVAGVVNFKLKHNFQGVTIDAQTGETFVGDGAQSRVTALLGSNFADDRGNAMLGISYEKRQAVYNLDRDFFSFANYDPGTPGAINIPLFSGYQDANSSQAVVNAIFAAKGYPAGDVKATNTIYFNRASTVAGSTAFTTLKGFVSGKTGPGFIGPCDIHCKLTTAGIVATNSPLGQVSLPLERRALFADGHYDFNEYATFYIQGNFNQNDTNTRSGSPSPAVNQWGVLVPRDAAHPVPAELTALLDSRPNPAAPWTYGVGLWDMAPMRMATNTNVYEILTGVKGKLWFSDWTYDVFASQGKTSASNLYSGLADQAALQLLVASPNYGANTDFTNGRVGRSAYCTSGINPFLNQPISADCQQILETSLKINTSVEQTQLEMNIQGGVIDLPAGEIRAAFGADYRKETAEYLVDKGVSAQNIVNSAIGMFGTNSTTGSTKAKEVYVEALIPVFKDVPLVKSLNLNAGYRFSDYDTAGNASTWKLTADWDIIDYIKIRGGYQVANRAPNVAELYQAPQQVQANWGDHDPCSILTVAKYGNVASNPNRAKVQALCSALSGGFPIDSTFIGNQPVYFPAGVDLTRGNQNLRPEEARTWTLGAVLRSPFELDALRNLTLSLDYYSIDIEDAIGVASTQPVYQSCLNGLGTNPTYDPNNDFCKRIIRLPTNGYWVATDAPYSNLAFIKTSGFDVQLDWHTTTAFIGGRTGNLFANINYSNLQKYDVQAFTGATLIHYKDAIATGYANSFPFGAQFKWKLFSTIGYSVGTVSTSMNWRHLPSINNLALATNPAAPQLPTDSYDLFDLAGQWQITPRYSVRAGVDNLFDVEPNKVGVNPGVTNATAQTDRGVYDVYGRRFYVGVTAKF